MKEQNLSEQLTDFLKLHIRSVRQLETLLWLHANSKTDWTIATLAQSVFCEEQAVSSWLDDFQKLGLVVKKPGQPPTYVYSPSRRDLDVLVTELAQELKIRPLRIIRTLGSVPAGSLDSFLDAFRFDKKD